MLSIVDCICHVVGSFLFKQKTAYEMRIGDWSSDVCSSDLLVPGDSEGYIGGGRRTVNTQICHPSIFFPTSSEGLSGSRDQRIPSALSSACSTGGRSSPPAPAAARRSEEHTSELQSLMRISYAVFCLKKKTNRKTHRHTPRQTIHTQTPCRIHQT